MIARMCCRCLVAAAPSRNTPHYVRQLRKLTALRRLRSAMERADERLDEGGLSLELSAEQKTAIADELPVGGGLAMKPAIELPAPSQPMAVAREFVRAGFTHLDGLLLRYWHGAWWRWATSHWVEVEEREVRTDAYRFTESAFYYGKGGPDPLGANAPQDH